jgi:uncharacterized protein (TIGR03000 family)
MVRHRFSVYALLALGVICLAADASQAQIFRGRRGGGFRNDTFYNSGPYYYYDAAGNPMMYNAPMVRYREPGRFNYLPSNYYMPGQTIQPAAFVSGQTAEPATGAQQSFYSGPPNAVLLDVRVPTPDAQILIDGAPTRIRGMLRQFVSPPLEPGKVYSYELTAKYFENGEERTRTIKQEVLPGQQYTFDFTRLQQPQP